MYFGWKQACGQAQLEMNESFEVVRWNSGIQKYFTCSVYLMKKFSLLNSRTMSTDVQSEKIFKEKTFFHNTNFKWRENFAYVLTRWFNFPCGYNEAN